MNTRTSRSRPDGSCHLSLCLSFLLAGVQFLADTSALAQPRATPASAPAVDAQRQKDAVVAFKQGKAAFESGNFLIAVEHFKRADAIVPGAAPRFMLAQAYEKLEKPSEAAAAYGAFLELKPEPASAYGKRVPEANARLAALASVLPALVHVSVMPASATPVFIIDGAAGQRSPLFLPPGKHTVVVSSEGFKPHTETLFVAPSEKRELRITLKADVARVAPPPDVTPPAPRTRVGASAVLCFGFAGAGAVVGGIFGGLALKERARFYDAPSVDAADATERNALISDIAFGTALAAGVTGAALVLLSDDAQAMAAGRTLPELRPWVGASLGGAQVRWSF